MAYNLTSIMSIIAFIVLAALLYIILLKQYKKNINELSRLSKDIMNEKQWTKAILTNLENGLILADNSGNTIYANRSLARIIDKNQDELVNKSVKEILYEIKERIHGEVICPICNKQEDNEIYNLQGHHQYTNKCGDESCMHVNIYKVKGNDNEALGEIITIPNLEECDKAHQIIHRMAHYDLLTGLANRALINESLENMINDSKILNSKLAVAFIDLDNFKSVNDTMGHEIGDIMLAQVGRVMQNSMKEDIVGRFGGDEFIIIMPEIKNSSEAFSKINKLITNLNKTLYIKKRELNVTASIGLSIYPEDGSTVDELIRNADMAMYSSKNNGKNNCQIYNTSMNLEISKKLNMIDDMKRAIKKEEFVVHYQPQIDINTNEVIGMEALIRWNHPVKGEIPPLEFIPLAEETGLIIPIGEWVLREACRQNKLWQDSGYKPIRMAVNLSLVQFEHEDFVKTVEKVLSDTGLDGKWLELEITESIAVNCFECAIKRLGELKKFGLFISLDDFGTGYSSYNYLNQIPLDSLKIDKTFLKNLMDDSNEEFITKTIISLAKRLNLSIVAEGVENVGQLNFLKREQCNIAQGFLFSKPVPAEELVNIIEKYNMKAI